MTAPVTIVHVPSPFAAERRTVCVDAGPTLAAIAAATKTPADQLVVALDGVQIPEERWAETTPQAGAHVLVSRRPGDPGSIVTALIQTAVYLAGQAAISYAVQRGLSLFIDGPNLGSKEGGPGVRRTVAGDRNWLPRYEPGVQVLGRHKLVAPKAAATYTVLEDAKLVEYSLYTFGKGPLELSDLRIGEDPIFKPGTTIVYTGQMEANGVVQKTTLELRQGTPTDAAITLYSADVQEKSVNEVLRHDKPVTHRTVEGTVRIVVLVGFVNGLVWIDHHGRWKERTVRIQVEYRAAGSTGAWTEAQQFTVTDKTRDSVFVKRAIEVSEGTYDVRLRRVTEEDQDQGIFDQAVWAVMHQHRTGTVVAEPNLCRVAMRRQLTNNSSGQATEDFSAIALTVCPDWDAATETWIERGTANPASLYRHVLQGAANLRPVVDARIDLVTLAAWHEENDAEGFEFNWVTTGRGSVWETLRKIAAVGRASAAMQDGLFTVVRDTPLIGTPTGFYTPRNVISFTGRRVYDEKPHGWKVPWVNPDDDYLDTEDIVYDDGYSSANATTFDRLELAGITDWDHAWKLGRYHLAQVRLRPEEYVIDTPIGSLNNVRGDWVKFAHDACLIGLAYGRVLAVAVDGSGNATGVTVDQQCPMAAATYGIRFFRRADAGSVHADVVTNAGNQTVLVFTAVIASASKPAVGDAFSFGETGEEMIDCRVKSIEPGEGHTARLVLVDAAAAALDAADGTIPAYESHVTIPPTIAPSKKLPKPRLLSVESVTIRSQEQRTAASAGIRIRLGLPALQVRK